MSQLTKHDKLFMKQQATRSTYILA